MKPLRAFVAENRRTLTPGEMPEWVDHYSIPALDAGAPEFVESSTIDSHKVHLLGGELLVSRLNPRKPRVHLSPQPLPNHSVASTEFVTLRILGGDSRYLRFLLLSEGVRQDLDAKVRSATRSHQRVEPGEILAIPVPVVGTDDQRRIADFLDDRVARIDQIITARRQQIALLGESHDAALHEFVELASVGIPRRRLGAMATIGSGGFLPSTEFVDEGPVPVFGGNGFAGCFDRANTHADAIVVGRVGALCGNVHLIESPTWVTDNALVVELREPTLSSAYVAAVLADRNLNRIASQTAQPLITGTQVGDQQIPLLAEAEQAEVVKRWRLTGDVGQGATLRRSIALLTEYKQSLITAAVTGEIDVRTASSRIPG